MRKNAKRVATKSKTISKATNHDVVRILAGTDAAKFVTAVAGRASSDLADIDPVVPCIVADVRRNGDRAVRHYATLWDALKKRAPLLVPEDELHQAWEQSAPGGATSD